MTGKMTTKARPWNCTFALNLERRSGRVLERGRFFHDSARASWSEIRLSSGTTHAGTTRAKPGNGVARRVEEVVRVIDDSQETGRRSGDVRHPRSGLLNFCDSGVRAGHRMATDSSSAAGLIGLARYEVSSGTVFSSSMIN